MNWFHLKDREPEQQQKPRIASRSEIMATFDEERDYLFRIALLITGNTTAATRSIVNATELAPAGGGVFHDWLIQWAHRATARAAVDTVRDLIAASASGYADWECVHEDHYVFS